MSFTEFKRKNFQQKGTAHYFFQRKFGAILITNTLNQAAAY